MTLHVAPGHGFFGTQRTVIWIFQNMNLHVALSVVCGCMVFAIYIPNINLFGTFSMLHFVLPSSNCFVIQVFFFINLIAIIKMVMSEVLTMVLLHPHMLCEPPF